MLEGLRLVGSNLTEATTNSIAEVDLLSVSGLSIPASTPFIIMCNYRKTAGAAVNFALGLKLNTTTVAGAVVGASRVATGSTTDQAEDGYMLLVIGPRIASYLRPGIGFFVTYSVGGNVIKAQSGPFESADAPTGTITNVTIRAISGSSLVTVGVDELRVYSFTTV